ncbi:MAG: HlyD family efflux transporter periplasmic adaptor subunit [Pseudohongiellaceae bacterium]
MNTYLRFISLMPVLWLSACEEPPPLAMGQLESDRVELIAEVNEPITHILVTEGDRIQAGETVLQQDSSRIDTRLDQARANSERLRARVEELQNGPRPETITATRAALREATVERDFRERELARLSDLGERNLTSQESVDTARKLLATATARVEQTAAQLAELEAGTRPEQIAQSRSALAEAEAMLASLDIDRRRLAITAPIAALVDSLPFEPGERPAAGAVVAVLLTGEQPYARVYIPEPQRVNVRVGSELPVHIDGREAPVPGTVRRIASEATFTPYFALTERDRSRLSYVAELTLPPQPERLPDGVPVQVLFE